MSKCRPRDRLWDALVEAMGTQAPVTRSARGAWNAAHRELLEAGITPEQVLEAARCYRQEWPHMALTPNALTKHLHLFLDVPPVPNGPPARLWVDPVDLGKEGAEPIVLRFPDGSTARGKGAFIDGPSELVYRPEGYPDGKHVALETYADVELA